MVRSIMWFGNSVWDPYTDKLQDELEKVQSHAARHPWTIEMESLKKRRKDNRLIFVIQRSER